jgi:hypothetical protein
MFINSFRYSNLHALPDQTSKRNLILLFRQNLRKYELHFFLKKNDMLDTELNFARIWGSTT